MRESAVHRTAFRWVQGGVFDGMADLDRRCLTMRPPPRWAKRRARIVRAKDRAFFIYTSGTTGLPKAANFSHMRMLFMMYGFVGALNAKASDRMYNALPLYHATGGVCAVGSGVLHGRRGDPQAQILGAANSGRTIHKYAATMFAIYRRAVPLSAERAARPA